MLLRRVSRRSPSIGSGSRIVSGQGGSHSGFWREMGAREGEIFALATLAGPKLPPAYAQSPRYTSMWVSPWWCPCRCSRVVLHHPAVLAANLEVARRGHRELALGTPGAPWASRAAHVAWRSPRADPPSAPAWHASSFRAAPLLDEVTPVAPVLISCDHVACRPALPNDAAVHLVTDEGKGVLQQHRVLAKHRACHDARPGAHGGPFFDDDAVKGEDPPGVGVAYDEGKVDACTVPDAD
eukprot:scaffold174109_cov30-Tisochrysis_lutea.AAC.2